MQYKNQKHEKKDVARKADDRTKATAEPSRKKKPKSIAPISKRRSEELKEYRKVRDEYFKENPACEICGSSRNLTLHHKKPRAYHLCDISVFMTACFTCHERIHREDKWARDNGYLLSKF